jgi:hypothetical protein
MSASNRKISAYDYIIKPVFRNKFAILPDYNHFLSLHLQVLTANIAVILDLYGVERGLDHYRSTTTLSFEHFQYYLTKEVFASISNDLTLAQQRAYESKIEEVSPFNV